MNELIKIEVRNGQQLARGRELHKFLEVGTRYNDWINRIIEKYNLKKSELAMVGDRLYTDIRTGIDNGLTSILVMSGETDKKMLEETIYKPDYIFNSVKELKEKID